jgi:hypothetical protein
MTRELFTTLCVASSDIPILTSIKLFRLKPAFRTHPGMLVGSLLHELPSRRISDDSDDHMDQATRIQLGIQDSNCISGDSDTHPAPAAAFVSISEELPAPVAWVREQWDKLVNMVGYSGAR